MTKSFIPLALPYIISPMVAALASLVTSVFTPKQRAMSSARRKMRRFSSGSVSPSRNFHRLAGISIVPWW